MVSNLRICLRETREFTLVTLSPTFFKMHFAAAPLSDVMLRSLVVVVFVVIGVPLKKWSKKGLHIMGFGHDNGGGDMFT